MSKPIKWILINGEIRLSTCLYHRDLLEKNERGSEVDGGGIVTIDIEENKIILHGKSDDFGIVKPELLKKALQNERNINRIKWICEMIGQHLLDIDYDLVLNDFEVTTL